MGVRYPYQNTTKDGSGKVICSATVAVFLTGTATPASIYAASTGGVAVNSVTSGADTSSAPGYFIFWIDRDNYAASQEFDITISKSGFNTQTYLFIVIDNSADYLSSPSAHKTSHQDGGVDEISVTNLSGLLADDQHVLDSEVLAYLLSLSGAAANLKSFINAAGTGVEWKTGIKIGTFTRDTGAADGNVGYTGIGFKPSHIIFCAVGANANELNFVGFDDGVNHYGLHYTQTVWSIHPTYSILLYQTTVIYALANIFSWDADGFTLTWTKNGAKTGTAAIIWMAFR